METIEYKGDHAKALHNRILGPNFDGDYFVVTDTAFANDITVAHLRPATEDELATSRWESDGGRFVVQ